MIRRLIRDLFLMAKIRKKIRAAVRYRARCDGVPFKQAWRDHLDRINDRRRRDAW